MPLSFAELRALANLVKNGKPSKTNTASLMGELEHETINKIDECMVACGAKKSKIIVFTESTEWMAPSVTKIEVFAVGGGGAGKTTPTGKARNGGNGGQVILTEISIGSGTIIPVIIGAGAICSTKEDSAAGTPGGNTSFGDVIAQGGLGGSANSINNGTNIPNIRVENSALGGVDNIRAGYSGVPEGEDGQLCPFNLEDYPELNGRKFGAAGSAGNIYSETTDPFYYAGGETGGGIGGYGKGTDVPPGATSGSFYGAGGGGGCSSCYSRLGGDGYQGIVIIKY